MADFLFSSDVHDESVNLLIDRILEASDAGETTIRLLLMTCGGDLNAAFAAYDRLRLLQRERNIVIETVGVGYCLSSGVVLLQAGTTRYATPHTIFMLHQPEQYPWTEEKSSILPDELVGRLALSCVTRDLLADIFARRTNTSWADWEKRLNNQPTQFFTVQEALADRLIDAVLPVE